MSKLNICKRFFLYLGIGAVCALIPFLHYSLIFGFPAIFLNSILLTALYVIENKESERVGASSDDSSDVSDDEGGVRR